MIVRTDELARHAGRVSMVDGGFDPLHVGHIEYMRLAAELGDPVLCNVSSDDYLSAKHPPLLPEEQRIRVIDAIRYVSFSHLSRTTTAEVLRLLRPRRYVKGDDWRGRLPAEEIAVCESLGIEIVYLDSVVDSSTRLLARYRAAHED